MVVGAVCAGAREQHVGRDLVRDHFRRIQRKHLCGRGGAGRKRAARDIDRSLCVCTPPMYAGAGLLLVATPIGLGSWWGIPVGLVLCAVIVVRLLDEERRLAADLSGYEEYRAESAVSSDRSRGFGDRPACIRTIEIRMHSWGSGMKEPRPTVAFQGTRTYGL